MPPIIRSGGVKRIDCTITNTQEGQLERQGSCNRCGIRNAILKGQTFPLPATVALTLPIGTVWYLAP